MCPTAFTKVVSLENNNKKKKALLPCSMDDSISSTHQVQFRCFWKQFHIGPATLYSILEIYFIPYLDREVKNMLYTRNIYLQNAWLILYLKIAE